MVSDRRGLGERLKRHRERRGITLEQISNSSKVPASLFAALEAGDCSRWPAGLYARAYIRAYAEAVGLNPEETVEEFAAAFGATLKSDGIEAPPVLSSRAPSALRLSLVEESLLPLTGLGWRAGLAAVDVLLGSLIAAITYKSLSQNVWITVAFVLSYFAVGRLISDEPLLYYVYRRIRVRSAVPVAPAEAPAEVAPVADAASTVA